MSLRRIALILLASACARSAATSGNDSPAPRAEAAVWPDEGPATWTPRATETAITANDLRTRLYQFADDSMLGRRIGEIGNYKGTDYIAREFRRLGLEPGGDSGTFFQNLPFGPAAFDERASQLTVGSSPLAARSDWIPLAPSPLYNSTDRAALANAAVVFAGRWGDTATVLDPAVYRGKVLAFVATPAAVGLAAPSPRLQRCDSLPDRFGAAAAIRAQEQQRAAGANAAGPAPGGGVVRDGRVERVGAAGVLLIVLDSTTSAAADAAFAPRQTMRPSAPPATAIPVAAVSRAAAQRIFGSPVDALALGATGHPMSARWTWEWHASPTPGRNVIAILRGANPARASEYVLVGAHNDHVGVNRTVFDHDSLRAVNTVTRRQGANDPVCRPTDEQQRRIDSLIARARSIRPPRRDSIMNGADDDGSGTVIMLEVAEQFAKERPARSIVFVSHQGEEAGLLGSRWFTDHPTIPLASVVAALNMDMEAKGHAGQVVNGAPNSIQTLGSRRLAREFGDIVDSIATNSPTNPMAVDHTWDVPANPMNRFCRSDQVNYVHHDIPTTYFSTGYSQDYHQATDEPRYADYDHMARIGTFIRDIMWTLATREKRLTITGPDPSYPRCR